MSIAPPCLIIALDFPTAAEALALADRLDPSLCRLKVGKELFTRAGPTLIEALHTRGFSLFLDLKYHDIPNTVANACQAAAELGVWMVNVHALGGRRMMEAASEALAGYQQRPLLIAVTVLTSLTGEDLHDIGMVGALPRIVSRLARLAQDSGLDGVVCSAQEAPLLRTACGESFQLVTPGIRLANSHADDQRRVMSPQAAIANGANYLVIGRPVTQAENPLATLQEISAAISA